MRFQNFYIYPPDRDGRVIQLIVRHDNVIDIPADVYRQRGQAMITLFARDEGAACTYPLDDFTAAVQAAAAALDGPPPEPT